jgi:FkbM family methyltransferase
MRIVQNIKNALILVLNRKGLRYVLSLIFTIIASLKNFNVYFIYYDSNATFWIHKVGNLVLRVDDKPNFSISYKRLKSTTNIFLSYYSPKPNDVIIDLGAGIGEDVVVMHQMQQLLGKIYAIEAHPRTFAKLKCMVEMNKFDNVICCNVAIDSEPGRTFISNKANHSSNRVSKWGEIQINAITLDEFIAEKRVSRIDFLKLNIEGAERSALAGLMVKNTIVRNFAIACHDKLAQFYNDDYFYKTKDFVFEFFKQNSIKVVDKKESLYHIILFANNYGR